MNRILLATAAAVLFATAAQAQVRAPMADPDADKDGKVTLAEFKAANTQRQDQVFARLDSDRNGKITQAEIDAAGQRAKGAGRKAPGAMLMRLDADKDGAVTRAEMAAMSDRRFKMADANKDGWLSNDELLTMQQRRGGPGAQ